MAKVGNLKLDFMAKSIGIHFFEFEDMFRCLRDNENLKKHLGHMYTLSLYRPGHFVKMHRCFSLTAESGKYVANRLCYNEAKILCNIISSKQQKGNNDRRFRYHIAVVFKRKCKEQSGQRRQHCNF